MSTRVERTLFLSIALWLFLIIITIFLVCNNHRNNVIEMTIYTYDTLRIADYYPNGNIKGVYRMDILSLKSNAIEYYQNGNVKSLGQYILVEKANTENK